VSRTVHPPAALSHPLFLAALVTLALNDHLLKSAAALPALSGKLSDVAGLLVAPAVLAWLARVRTRRGWLGCHVAVGLGFAAIQLAPIAAAIEATLPWRIWPDPTDLLALPALALSAVVLGRARREPGWLARPIGAVALALCAASGGPGYESPPRYPFPPAGRLETAVFIRNHLAADLPIGVRMVRDDRTLDCDAILQDPLAQLEGGDFDDEQQWTVAARDAVPLWDRRGGARDRDCYAVRLKARGREWLLTWRHGTPPLRDIPVRLQPHETAESGAMRISEDPDTPPYVPAAVTVRVWEE